MAQLAFMMRLHSSSCNIHALCWPVCSNSDDTVTCPKNVLIVVSISANKNLPKFKSAAKEFASVRCRYQKFKILEFCFVLPALCVCLLLVSIQRKPLMYAQMPKEQQQQPQIMSLYVDKQQMLHATQLCICAQTLSVMAFCCSKQNPLLLLPTKYEISSTLTNSIKALAQVQAKNESIKAASKQQQQQLRLNVCCIKFFCQFFLFLLIFLRFQLFFYFFYFFQQFFFFSCFFRFLCSAQSKRGLLYI